MGNLKILRMCFSASRCSREIRETRAKSEDGYEKLIMSVGTGTEPSATPLDSDFQTFYCSAQFTYYYCQSN